MTTATLTKVGNSMAVLLPKALREQAGFAGDSKLDLASPRKGVVVITSMAEDGEDRLARLAKTEARLSKRTMNNPWPVGLTAEEILSEGKDDRTHGIDSL